MTNWQLVEKHKPHLAHLIKNRATKNAPNQKPKVRDAREPKK